MITSRGDVIEPAEKAYTNRTEELGTEKGSRGERGKKEGSTFKVN